MSERRRGPPPQLLHERHPPRDSCPMAGMDSLRLPNENDPELVRLVDRYVMPGRRYLELLHANFLRLPEQERSTFVQHLRADSATITDPELTVLLSSEWRSRLCASWMIAAGRRAAFARRLGELLLASELTFQGQGFCAPSQRSGIQRRSIAFRPTSTIGFPRSTAAMTRRGRWPRCSWSMSDRTHPTHSTSSLPAALGSPGDENEPISTDRSRRSDRPWGRSGSSKFHVRTIQIYRERSSELRQAPGRLRECGRPQPRRSLAFAAWGHRRRRPGPSLRHE